MEIQKPDPETRGERAVVIGRKVLAFPIGVVFVVALAAWIAGLIAYALAAVGIGVIVFTLSGVLVYVLFVLWGIVSPSTIKVGEGEL